MAKDSIINPKTAPGGTPKPRPAAPWQSAMAAARPKSAKAANAADPVKVLEVGPVAGRRNSSLKHPLQVNHIVPAIGFSADFLERAHTAKPQFLVQPQA